MTDTRDIVIALHDPPDGRDDKDSLMREAAEEIEALRLLVDDLEGRLRLAQSACETAEYDADYWRRQYDRSAWDLTP